MVEKAVLWPRVNCAIFTGWTPLVVRDGRQSAHLATENCWGGGHGYHQWAWSPRLHSSGRQHAQLRDTGQKAELFQSREHLTEVFPCPWNCFACYHLDGGQNYFWQILWFMATFKSYFSGKFSYNLTYVDRTLSCPRHWWIRPGCRYPEKVTV